MIAKLTGKQCTGTECNLRPSITLYLRLFGQQVSFLHLEESEIAAMVMASTCITHCFKLNHFFCILVYLVKCLLIGVVNLASRDQPKLFWQPTSLSTIVDTWKVSVFKTMLVTTKEHTVLQPSGNYLTTRLQHVLVLRLNGTLNFEFSNGQPAITFETDKDVKYVIIF